MASTSQAHHGFPSRKLISSLAQSNQLPDRGASSTFSASSHTNAARENARLERERLERERFAQTQAQAQAQQNAQQGAMAQLTDEQRDEINEAVSPCAQCSDLPYHTLTDLSTVWPF